MRKKIKRKKIEEKKDLMLVKLQKEKNMLIKNNYWRSECYTYMLEEISKTYLLLKERRYSCYTMLSSETFMIMLFMSTS